MENTNDSKKMQIKSHGWHDVTLTGNLLTGDTYKVIDFIKKYLGGKWDGQHKGWRVDLEKVAAHINDTGTTLTSR